MFRPGQKQAQKGFGLQVRCKELDTVYSGNSKRLNSEQSLISEHFW